MTQDEIIFMARASGWMSEYESSTGFSAEAAFTFAKLVAKHEREACAKLADAQLMNTSALMSMPPKSSAAWDIAIAIRARGNT